MKSCRYDHVPSTRPLRVPIYIPLAVYGVVGTVMYLLIAAFIVTTAYLPKFLTVFFLVIALLNALVQHYLMGKFSQRWLILLAMLGVGWLFLGVLYLGLAVYVFKLGWFPNVAVVDLTIGAVRIGVIGAFVNLICASISIFIERRYLRRKHHIALVRDVF